MREAERVLRRRPGLSLVVEPVERRYTAFAALLVVFLVGVVPFFTLVFGLPVQVGLLLAGATYLATVLVLDRLFEGLVVALFVSAGFNLTAHLNVAEVSGLAVRLVDVLVVLTLGLCLVERGLDRTVFDRRGPTLVVGSLSVFVLWTALSTVLGNTPSTHHAMEYAIQHLRYLVLLLTTALLVAEVGPRAVLSPLALGMAGALGFAVDDVFGGHAGYLINFGPLEGLIRGVWPTTSITAIPMESTIVYDGVVGHSRILVGIGILLVPLVLAAATRSRKHALFASAGILGVVNVVASGSHAGLIGLYGGVVTCLVYFAYLSFDRLGLDRVRDLVVPLSAVVGVVAVLWVLLATAAGMEELLFVRTNNMGVRLRQYATAVDLARQNPLFGIGGGWNFRITVGEGIHNLFLANLAATGVVGFLAFATSQLAVPWLCLTRLRDRPDTERWLWVGIFAALVGFYTYTFWVVAHRWEPLNALYWVLAGVVVGASVTTTDDSNGGLRGRLQGLLPNRRHGLLPSRRHEVFQRRRRRSSTDRDGEDEAP